jgi:hypothetical protein
MDGRRSIGWLSAIHRGYLMLIGEEVAVTQITGMWFLSQPEL